MVIRMDDSISTFAFMKLREVRGVKRAFVFFRYTGKADGLQESEGPENIEGKLKIFLSFFQNKFPKKISIQSSKGEIILYTTEKFLLGAVIDSDANPVLVHAILGRIVSRLDTDYERFRTADVKTIEGKIRKKIEDISPFMNPVVSLVSRNAEVEGEIRVRVNSMEKEYLTQEIQNILHEEIPFFCKKNITVDISV